MRGCTIPETSGAKGKDTEMTRLVFAFLTALCFFSSPAYAAPLLFGCPERDAVGDPFFELRYSVLWNRVVTRERESPSFTPGGERFNSAEAAQWRNLVHYARSCGFHDTLRMVNGYFNRWRPKSDTLAWQTEEHWATPAEFISQRGGDCEDYAIAKYFALRALNISPDTMRLVIIRQRDDKGKFVKELHAVLAVRGPSQDAENWFILDNNARPRDGITLHTQYGKRFVPLFSMNENGAWAHCKDPLSQ